MHANGAQPYTTPIGLLQLRQSAAQAPMEDAYAKRLQFHFAKYDFILLA
ncbi:hypothetical protein [Sphingobium fuliginis]|nr:hypothetical protein [Sphingobium fuliginis]